MFVSAEERPEGGREGRAASSRFAQSMTMRIPSMSPSTSAKNLVSSMARVFRDSPRSSSSCTRSGAEVKFAARTVSERSHTATDVSCRVPICERPLSE